MKRFQRLIITVVIASLLMVSLWGCYGSMTLTKKIYDWNGSLGDDIKVNVVFWVLLIVPVYQGAAFLDVVFLNTIEHWTGSNPIAMNEGEETIKYVDSGNKSYKLVFSKNNIYIEEVKGPEIGENITLNFNEVDQSWYLVDDDASTKIASLNDDILKLIYPDGNTRTVHLAR